MAEALAETIDLLVQLSRAVGARSMYPAQHPNVKAAMSDLMGALRPCLDKRGDDEITFLIIDREVIIDDRPLRTKTMHLRPFVRIMDRLRIQRMTLARGLEAEEAHTLLGALAGAQQVESTAHVVIGQVELGSGEAGGSGEGGLGGTGTLSEEDLDRGSTAFSVFRRNPVESIDQLDRLVWRTMEGLASSSRALLLLAPVKTFDQHLFLHSINVSALAVAQARSLGIEGTALHEIGLAALLHDMGKLSLPEKLWQEDGLLEGRKWEVARIHPELGAALLSGTEGVPPLAVLVAYEHHLRWDGQPSYPRCDRQPNLASQITAVADTWDVLSAGRDDLTGPRRSSVLKVWRERSGTFLDPFLVSNFLLMMSEVGAGP